MGPAHHGHFREMNNARQHIKGFEKYCSVKDGLFVFFKNPFPKPIGLLLFF